LIFVSLVKRQSFEKSHESKHIVL